MDTTAAPRTQAPRTQAPRTSGLKIRSNVKAGCTWIGDKIIKCDG